MGNFGSNLTPLSNKMKLSLKNWRSQLKIIVIGEMSMVSHVLCSFKFE